jgi:hypothetical protein
MWYKVNKRLVWTKQVRPSWWNPWANTVAYYPLTADFNDKSWNWYNLTVSNASITNLNWVSCGYYSNGRAYNTSAPVGTQRTLSAWVYNITTSWAPAVIWTWASQGSWYCIFLALTSGTVEISDFYRVWVQWGTLSKNTWHNIVAVNDNTSMKIYVDGVLKGSNTHTRTDASTWISVWGKPFTNQYDNNCTWYISNAIIEKAVWSDTDVANYYNLTKSDYWL